MVLATEIIAERFEGLLLLDEMPWTTITMETLPIFLNCDLSYLK